MKRNRIKRTISALTLTVFAVILSAGLCVTALASDSSQVKSEMVDPSKTGSITVTISATDGTIPGGTLNLYRVAEVRANDTGYHFFYTDEFSSAMTDISDNSVDLTTEEFAEELAAIVSSKSLSTYLPGQAVGTDGKAVFTSFPVGVYLIIQNDVDEGYSAVDPFVVTVPVSQEVTNSDGSKEIKLTYDVDATPKAGTAAVNPTETPTATPTATPTPTTSTSSTTTTTTVNKTTTTVTARTVKTGDTSNFVLWGMLLIVTAVVISGVVFYGRRSSNR